MSQSETAEERTGEANDMTTFEEGATAEAPEEVQPTPTDLTNESLFYYVEADSQFSIELSGTAIVAGLTEALRVAGYLPACEVCTIQVKYRVNEAAMLMSAGRYFRQMSQAFTSVRERISKCTHLPEQDV